MFSSLLSMLVLCSLSGLTVFAQEGSQTDRVKQVEPDGVTYELKEFNLTDRILELRCQINNRSENDIWICEDAATDRPYEAQLLEEDHTLLIRRRLDVPTKVEWSFPPTGRYVRLPSKDSRTESLLLALPVRQRTVFLGVSLANASEPAKRIRIEVGYYSGDLPAMIRRLVTGTPDSSDNRSEHVLARLKEHLRLPYFNEINEHVRNRNEEVVVPYTWQGLPGENVLQIWVEHVRIPCSDYRGGVPPSAPDLTACTRLEIQYERSMLEYFFPYGDEQNLLGLLEKDGLTQRIPIVVDDVDSLRVLSRELLTWGLAGGFAVEGNAAQVKCFDGEKLLTRLSVYGNTDIETAEGNRFRYFMGLEALRAGVSALQPFELRIQCAACLKNLWYRFRLYQRVKNPELGTAPEGDGLRYPTPTTWCNEIVSAYRATGMLDRNVLKPLVGPSSHGNESSYAMNPNCRPDSPADMVLLFETKGGWNQHGGPELFTFDNHDPKGGLVLLNDGTVKFIRAEEELKQLRWK